MKLDLISNNLMSMQNTVTEEYLLSTESDEHWKNDEKIDIPRHNPNYKSTNMFTAKEVLVSKSYAKETAHQEV